MGFGVGRRVEKKKGFGVGVGFEGVGSVGGERGVVVVVVERIFVVVVVDRGDGERRGGFGEGGVVVFGIGLGVEVVES